MIKKTIKEYGTKSKRLRIDINKIDGLEPGSEVNILTAEEYEEIKSKLFEYNAISQQLEVYKDQEQNLKEIIEDVTAPIYENHKKELEKRDNTINQLQAELKTLKAKVNHFIIEVSNLSALDILFRGKLKNLITDINNEFWITNKDAKIDIKDAPALSDKLENKN